MPCSMYVFEHQPQWLTPCSLGVLDSNTIAIHPPYVLHKSCVKLSAPVLQLLGILIDILSKELWLSILASIAAACRVVSKNDTIP